MAEFQDMQAALFKPLEINYSLSLDYANNQYLELDYQFASNSIDVAWPNISKEFTTEFVRPSFLPGDTSQAGMGASGLDETNGLFQVDIYTKRGEGRSALVDVIGDLYKRGTVLTYGSAKVRVRGPSIGASRYEGDWFVTPIRINWQTYTEAR